MTMYVCHLCGATDEAVTSWRLGELASSMLANYLTVCPSCRTYLQRRKEELHRKQCGLCGMRLDKEIYSIVATGADKTRVPLDICFYCNIPIQHNAEAVATGQR